MDYNRLFYMNITYDCNNRCSFCISHNTKHKSLTVRSPLDVVVKANEDFHICDKDLFVINGGEPTVAPDFCRIVAFLKRTRCHIVVYTNGRLLHIPDIKKEINDISVRCVVPFYGLSKKHDSFTNISGAFQETYEALHGINDSMRDRISIKLLIKDASQFMDFSELVDKLSSKYHEYHISFILNDNFEERRKLAEEASPFILRSYKKGYKLKLSNVPLCGLSTSLKSILNMYTGKMDTHIAEYLFIGRDNVHIIPYDADHNWSAECSACQFHGICTDNCLKYRPLVIDAGNIYLGEE